MTQNAAFPVFKDQIKALESIQELDLKMDGLKKKRAQFPIKVKQLEDQCNKLTALILAKNKAKSEIEKTALQTKAAIDLNNDRQTRAQQKLTGVGNTQEFNAANKEIEQLKKLNTQLEEQITKTKTDSDGIQKEIEGLEAQLTTLTSQKDTESAAIAGETGALDKELGVLQGDRNGLAAKVERRLLGQYDRVRGVRAGVGLAPAVSGRCSGCNMAVPPQLYNQIQKAIEAHQCPSCHRILFVPQS